MTPLGLGSIEPMHRAQWIDACVMQMNRIHRRAAPQLLLDVATELYEFEWQNDPAEVARTQCDEWPPMDELETRFFR